MKRITITSCVALSSFCIPVMAYNDKYSPSDSTGNWRLDLIGFAVLVGFGLLGYLKDKIWPTNDKNSDTDKTRE